MYTSETGLANCLFLIDINQIGIIVKRRFCSFILLSVVILTQGYHIFLLITKMIINYNYLTKKIQFNQGTLFEINNININIKRRMVQLIRSYFYSTNLCLYSVHCIIPLICINLNSPTVS